MTNAPTLFRFEGKPLNVSTDGGGDITFNAGDVCRVLELAHVASALRILDEDEKGVRDEHTLGGVQKVSFVTEPGLYKLIARSRKEAAKRFDRWVRHEVLPTIRKTGSFSVKPMDESEIVARAFQITHKQLEEAKQEIANLTPKADGFDRLANTIGRTNLREVGKALQIGSKRGIEFLREIRWTFRDQAGRWKAYAGVVDAGYVEMKYTTYTNSAGEDVSTQQVFVTPKGMTKLAQRLGMN